ncbi:cyclopropane-fatty-acyl-phospholipid synthase [Colletotrichum truncatum]|uniref:Cyclopropane-fatty-acyl-phospholipid synthase n=1 Tax=Colletotrichum truncatum TaxID=5467 RepID=A0ACC3YPS6_COLTU|nr:cyclopropane-fatty-acyl-phospholipid synthase [Colletotrichum truncatum]KAF6796810.1 cyclopropane-fatty-acyl-phospholipid synthase [Colletotrichum truncatum]
MTANGSIPTPPASATASPKGFEDFGLRTTSYPAIKNATLPADGAGYDSFSAGFLTSLLLLVPAAATWKVGGGSFTFAIFLFTLGVPISVAFWFVASRISPPIKDNVRGPGRPVEQYLSFKTEHDRAKYWGRHKISMETFTRMYFAGEVDFNGDALAALEYRHDWASFKFTWGLFRFVLLTLVPEVIMSHVPSSNSPDAVYPAKAVANRSHLEQRNRKHEDRGSDFYAWFLGPRMTYSSGIVSDMQAEESLEEVQDNKLAVVCEKINLKAGDKLLDIGCGWASLATFASVNYKAKVTGVAPNQNQADLGNWRLQCAGLSEYQSRIQFLKTQEVMPSKYDKITCLQVSEQVGKMKMSKFFQQCYDMLEDDGIFYVEVTGLRRAWQYEDLVWGLFLKKHIPEAGALWPLGRYVTALEAAGFEVQNIDTVGYHYSATLWRWYKNWVSNADKVTAKYGKRWYRIWEYFLAASTIASRQGTTSCHQITLVKNLNGVHRSDLHKTQFSVAGALASSKNAGKAQFPL